MKTLKIMLALVMLIWIQNVCAQTIYTHTKNADVDFSFETALELKSVINNPVMPTVELSLNDSDIIATTFERHAVKIRKPNPAVQANELRYYVFYPKASFVCILINGEKMGIRPRQHDIDIIVCDNMDEYAGFVISVTRNNKSKKEVRMTSRKVASDTYEIYIVTGDY